MIDLIPKNLEFHDLLDVALEFRDLLNYLMLNNLKNLVLLQ